jgi:hypothetical protein
MVCLQRVGLGKKIFPTNFYKNPILSTGGLFGSATTTSAPSSGGLFGSAPAVSAPSGGGLFGSSAPPSGGGLFGSAPKSADQGIFGSGDNNSNSGGGLFGSGGGFSGLGAKPDPEKAKINPFGGSGSTTSNTGNNQSLFGVVKPAAFGSGRYTIIIDIFFLIFIIHYSKVKKEFQTGVVINSNTLFCNFKIAKKNLLR